MQKQPPGPFTWPLIGNAFSFLPDMPRFVLGLSRRYGDISRFKMGGDTLVLLDRAEWIQRVLVKDADNFIKGRGLQRAKRVLGEGLLTSEGEFHLRQRRLAQRAFYQKHLRTYAAWMIRYALDHRKSWEDGQRIDLAEEMQRLTLRIVARTLFDADVDQDAGEVGEALHDFQTVFPYLLVVGTELLDRLPLPVNRRLNRARAKLDRIIYGLIARKREQPGQDLLSLLLLATDDEGDGGSMSDEQARDEAVTLFLAGHETTANALAWTYYLLSLHPRIRRRMHEEIDEVTAGEEPAVEHYEKLTFTRNVMAESMRLYPPAWATTRRALHSYSIGGYTFPAGTSFFVSPYVTHRKPEYWPEPLAFEPDRFKQPPAKFTYFPFGGGRRLCIGERFAWMEGVLLLATLSQSWTFRFEGTEPISHRASLTLRPRGGLPMRLQRRESGSREERL